MIKKHKIDGWYLPRRYPHFDREVGFDKARALVTAVQKVTHHAFLPFISYDLQIPHYSKEEKKVKIKLRPIAFSSHVDSHIFSYYSMILSEFYEEKLSAHNLGDKVIAYRKFTPKKCNIDFAYEAFKHVQKKGNCVAIAFDIRGFFDNLKHENLKRTWCELLGVSRLTPDHFAIYKAITKYSLVDRDALYKLLEIGRKKAENWIGPLCSPYEFRELVRKSNLIKTNSHDFGIPQGSPISALLSNIYMLNFDKTVSEICAQNGVFYRRYSDDILIICETGQGSFYESLIESKLNEIGLEIKAEKTQKSQFEVTELLKQKADKPLQYLGFTYDGWKILVRSNTVSRFHQRMRKGVRSARRAARKAAGNKGNATVFRKKLYELFSHLGKRNYLSYVKRASKKMNSEPIKKQHKSSWNKLNKYIENE